jgi:hypothetical protein
LTLLSFGVAASCGSSEEKHAVAAGGDDQGGDAGASAGRAGSAGSAGNAGSVGTAGALASGGEAGNAGSMPSAGAGNDAAGQGGASGQGGNEPIAGNGGASGPGGAGGAGGAACCSTSSYQASSQLLPNAVCSGWELVNGADTELPQLPGGYLRLSTSTVAENQYYKVAPEGLKAPAKLVIEARMQLISGSASAAYRAPANFGFVLDGKKNLLMIADGEIFILSAENTKGTSAAVATTDAMHVYRMEVDTALGTVEVFYDGVSKLTGSTFADPNGTPNFLYFGDGSLFGTGVSDWAYFTHNADACAG